MYMCLYDLQKTFDSVEYPVLLDHLFEAGMNLWGLLKNWLWSHDMAGCQRVSKLVEELNRNHFCLQPCLSWLWIHF